jgi:hypothetical protein
MKKKKIFLFIFITGSGASVASAAGHFTTQKKNRNVDEYSSGLSFASTEAVE